MSMPESKDSWRKHLATSDRATKIDDRTLEKAAKYLHLLYEWGQRMNLTSIRDPQEAAERHFWEAAPALPYLPPGKTLDIGSGAGFPGIPLKILRPELKITLLEPRKKRAVFLSEAIQKCGLEGIDVLAERLEDIINTDVAYSNFLWRAIKISLDDLEPLIRPGTPARCIAWTTVEAGREIEETGPNHWDTLHWVRTPATKDRVIFVTDHILPDKDCVTN